MIYFSTVILSLPLIQEGQLSVAGLLGSVGCAVQLETRRSRVHLDHEIFSTVILTLLLIQKGQLSVSGKRMCTILVNCLEN